MWALYFFERGTPFNNDKDVLGSKADINYANIGLPTKYDDYYGTPRIANETRSKNITVRLWKRIS